MCERADEVMQQRAPEVLHAQEHEAAPVLEQAPLLQAPAPGLVVEEARQEQAQIHVPEAEENLALQAAARAQLPAVHAERAAPGAPVQEQAPAKRSFKARQADKRHAKVARKACPVGTAATYDMVTDLQTLAAGKENAMRDHREITKGAGVDMRVLNIFCTGYRLDKKGRPATPEDAAAKAADDTFFADYCSKDLERRIPHLDRMVDDLLAVRFTPDLLSERNMRRNMGRLKELGDKVVYIENVMNDPVNKPYFDQLDPARREALELGMREMYLPFVGAFSMTAQRFGVDYNRGDYYGYGNEVPIQQGWDNAQEMQQKYVDAIAGYAPQRAAIDARQAARVREAATDYPRRMRLGGAALERIKSDPRLALRPGEESSPYLTRSVVLLQHGEEHDEENLETVRTLLEVGRTGDAPADPALYARTRALLQPRVEQVLACDVEALRALSDQNLLLKCAELDALFMDNMFVSDLMKLSHPSQVDNQRTPLTLKDDLLGQRQPEFAYKAAVLRGLAERARGLALGELCKTQNPGPDCFTAAERVKSGADPAAFAEQRIALGARLVDTAAQTYRDQFTFGTGAFWDYVENLVVRNNMKLAVIGNKFDAVTEQFSARSTPELAAAMERLHDSQYHSLAYTRAQRTEQGISETIGEPIFRAFGSFLKTEAAQTLLTPETLRQMLLDLGAGAGLDPDDPGAQAELEQAVAQNNQGLAVYREVVRAQYDMIARKYGNGLEDMKVTDVLAHYEDIARDFADAQVQLNMATKHPDFLNPEDPEDKLLLERIQYYSLLGNCVCQAPSFAFTETVTSDEGMRAQTIEIARSADAAPSRAYLLEHDPALQHGPDWSQRVAGPAGGAEA